MLNVPVLIDKIIAEMPDDYDKKQLVVTELEYIRKSAPYRAPECLYLSTEDIHMVLRNYILKYFDKNEYPDWINNVLAIYWEGVSLL